MKFLWAELLGLTQKVANRTPHSSAAARGRQCADCYGCFLFRERTLNSHLSVVPWVGEDLVFARVFCTGRSWRPGHTGAKETQRAPAAAPPAVGSPEEQQALPGRPE